MGEEFKPFGKLITYEEALSIILSHTSSIGRFEIVDIERATDRVLAEDVHAKVDIPPFNRSAMDGYAVISSDTIGASRQNSKHLKVIGRLYAGDIASNIFVSSNTCVEVATGAELPQGADAVVRVEDTERISDEEVAIFTAVEPWTNVSLKGYDKQVGDLLFEAGDVLNSGKIGVLAASGNRTVKVYEKPIVGVLPTGSEIVEPGDELPRGCIYDSNSYMLCAIATKAGCTPLRLAPVKDEFKPLCDAILEATNKCDMLVMTAGGSVGRRDFAGDVLSKLGELKFRGMRTRPGMPTLFAIVNGKPVISMPGHPVSCYTVANVLLFPALRKLCGVSKYEPVKKWGILTDDVKSPKDFHTFISVSLSGGKVIPVFRYSDTTSTVGIADGCIEIPIGVERIGAGAKVEVRLFEC